MGIVALGKRNDGQPQEAVARRVSVLGKTRINQEFRQDADRRALGKRNDGQPQEAVARRVSVLGKTRINQEFRQDANKTRIPE